VEEVRGYDVNDPSSYTSTQTYYGYHDKPLEVHAPGAPTMKYEYDAKGRRITNCTYADTVEVARTKTVYDADDRAINTIRWERKHDATVQNLNLQSAVRSYSHTWYDLAGRVIATANYGANNASSVFWGSRRGPRSCRRASPMLRR
jgi:YD repeat-containing protein